MQCYVEEAASLYKIQHKYNNSIQQAYLINNNFILFHHFLFSYKLLAYKDKMSPNLASKDKCIVQVCLFQYHSCKQ